MKISTGRPGATNEILDVCGTGGDRLNTFNISTTVAGSSTGYLAVRGFTQQFYAAQAQAATAAARISLARDGVIKAQDNLAASIARFRAGEAQIIEVTDAQATLVAQRTALYQAIFDYQIALGRLRQATGQ